MLAPALRLCTVAWAAGLLLAAARPAWPFPVAAAWPLRPAERGAAGAFTPAKSLPMISGQPGPPIHNGIVAPR